MHARNVHFYDCVHTVSVCLLVNVFVCVNGVVGRRPRHSHEPRRARNESGNGDDPRGL